jgi:hypothetical protein
MVFHTKPREPSSQKIYVRKKQGAPFVRFFYKSTIGCETAHEDVLQWVLFLPFAKIKKIALNGKKREDPTRHSGKLVLLTRQFQIYI